MSANQEEQVRLYLAQAINYYYSQETVADGDNETLDSRIKEAAQLRFDRMVNEIVQAIRD